MNKNIFVALTSLVALACGHSDDPFQGNESEVITTVLLTFTPEEGGMPVIAVFDDPDGEGGDAPTIDAIQLSAGVYTLGVRFENRLEEPAEDITAEVEDEAEEHQLFFTGSAVDGPASDNPGTALLHAYADQDLNGLPIGLENAVTAVAGSGELTVTLRHLPPVAGVSIKNEEVASEVRQGGFSAIGGSSDAQVSYSVTVP